MKTSSIIAFIELFSIVVGAVFGILGTATDTKDANHRLTRWGWVAIIGVILTNSFSFVNSFLKQREEQANEVKKSRDQRIKDSTQLVKDSDQLAFQNELINKTDTSLNTQLKIQKRTDTLLSGLNSSLSIQKSVLNSSRTIIGGVERNLADQKIVLANTKTINESQASLLDSESDILKKQKITNFNLDRSLNPLIPFAVRYSLTLHIDSFAEEANIRAHSALIKLREDIERAKRSAKFYDKTDKIRPIIPRSYNDITDDDSKSPDVQGYIITTDYKYYEDLVFARPGIYLTLYYKNYINNAPSDLSASVYVETKKTNADITKYSNFLFYAPDKNELTLFYYSENISIKEDVGKFKSVADLKDSYIGVSLDWDYGKVFASSIKLNSFKFYFFPNYSRVYEIRLNDDGKSTVDVFYQYGKKKKQPKSRYFTINKMN